MKLTPSDTNVPERIQQGRFANIGHPDDQHVKLHSMRMLLRYVCETSRVKSAASTPNGSGDILTRSWLNALMSRVWFHEAKNVLWSGYFVAIAR